MNKKKVLIVTGIVILIAAAAAVAWNYYGKGTKDSDDKVYVEKVSAIMGTATGNQNRYSGVVEPQKTVEVNADSERTVKDILVKVGDEVAEGTPLFNYDTDELAMDVEQKKLEIENIDIEISNFKNQVTELQTERDAAAEGNKFEYTTQIQTIQTSIKQSEFDKENKKLELSKTQKKMENSEVTSTIAGVIKTLNDPKSSDTSDSGTSAFMTILATGDFRIKGSVNEQNIASVGVGSQVVVRSRVDETLTWKGNIASIDTGDPSSSTDSDGGMAMDSGDSTAMQSSDYPFYVVLENADGLMLGQHVLIEMDQGQTTVKEGVWLYSTYIVKEGETAYVWADNGSNKLEKRMVELGEYDEALDEQQIKSGLSDSDMIAWPMSGLYEGVTTVTNMDEIDYESDLYNNTEAGMGDMTGGTEMMMDGVYGTESMMGIDGGMGVDAGMGLNSTESMGREVVVPFPEENLSTEVLE